MRWGYKTIHFELKKDGLLGGAFLDESEMELVLNDYGSSGWELVSILETRDGVVAVFKQPLDESISSVGIAREETGEEEKAGEEKVIGSPVLKTAAEREEAEVSYDDDEIYGFEDHVDVERGSEPEPDDEGEEGEEDGPDIGSIRIE